MERRTVDVYEDKAAAWLDARPLRDDETHRARRFAESVPTGAVRADVGCGPGRHLPFLGEPVVAVDAARAMLDLVPERCPSALLVQADLEVLPFRRHALAGAWSSCAYQHIPQARLPLALAHLHNALAVGAPLELTVDRGTGETVRDHRDAFGGRFFAGWEPGPLADVATGAGFTLESPPADLGGTRLHVTAVRARTLPDFVGPDMRLLVCGLNPSLNAADAGYGYAGPSNRFWRAAIAAGVITRLHDPWHAVAVDRVGFTDLVKRATPRATDLKPDEFHAGAARVARLVERLRPAAVCVVGLSGWRVAVDRDAGSGWQPDRFGGAPVYLMPSTSGLNAATGLAELTDHLRAAAAGR